MYAVCGAKRQNRNRRSREWIMRSFNSGRRSSCLKEALLALVLSAPISLNAQSGSSPQSQPAQSASAPPPATQSQTQSTPACSDAPPILKRGKQPDLPPCPDPPRGRAGPRGLHTHAFADPSAALDRKGQRSGLRVFTEPSQLYLPGGHGAIYAARPRRNAPGRCFG